MEKIIAKNSKGEELLPTKQSEEIELTKSIKQKATEVCNFIKNAFCVDGDVELIESDKPIIKHLFYKCKDSKRGEFFVCYGKLEKGENCKC